mmetsp:Transcript_123734/g.231507  ORF Transcript_123734/g.231507 Transcript_123734/m.231507 type:complete len:852 (+) Transcript_123734:56-2611(+)
MIEVAEGSHEIQLPGSPDRSDLREASAAKEPGANHNDLPEEAPGASKNSAKTDDALEEEKKVVKRRMFSSRGAPLKRRVSGPAAVTLFKPKTSASESTGETAQEKENSFSRSDRQLIRQMTGVLEDFEYNLVSGRSISKQHLKHNHEDDIVRNLVAVMDEQQHRGGRRASKQKANVSMGDIQEHDEEELGFFACFTRMDWIVTVVVAIISLGVVIGCSIWAKEGLLAKHGMGHEIVTNTRVGHMFSRMYLTPANVELHGTAKEYFEVRLIVMSVKPFDAHRRLLDSSGEQESDASRPLPATWQSNSQYRAKPFFRKLGSSAPVVGTLTYSLRADGEEFYKNTVTLRDEVELEHFQEVDVGDKGKNNAKHYTAYVTADRSDGQEVSFMLQVKRMPAAGRFKVALGIILFIVTFIGIVSEKIHRSYCAFIGASTGLGLVAAIIETPHLHTITGMINYGTLMLLFSMMILMRMLAVTGFFNWFAVKVVQISRQNPTLLFFLLTNLCGIMSMVLDNVTCVLLTGPLTYSLCKKMHLNPRPLYLAMTICATVGGTATYIGDPPNIVIGSKLQIGFMTFIIVNMPIVVVILPLCSCILYYRLKERLLTPVDGSTYTGKKLDTERLARENKIVDPAGFMKLSMVLGAILLALLLSPVHEIEPAWFTVLAMFGCAMIFEPHEFGKYLEFVEWDTLLFFALLFVFVEALAELGVIRQLGDWIIQFIQVFPKDAQVAVSVIVILWVSSIGSAFLESLPYTTTMVYIIEGLMRQEDDLDFKPDVLVWPLSVGACVGGIGSIMGSSANLVCMAVSKRFSENEEEKVQGGDFLKYGLPALLIMIFVVMLYQLLIFVAFGFEPEL